MIAIDGNLHAEPTGCVHYRPSADASMSIIRSPSHPSYRAPITLGFGNQRV